MQQTLDIGWGKRARLDGALRYHWKTLSRAVGWALLIILAAQAMALLAPMVIRVNFTYTGVTADLGLTMMLALLCGITVSHRSTRFLLRFGTSRLSVWLGNLIALMAGMTAFLLGTLLISMLTGALTLAISGSMPGRYAFQETFGGLRGSALYARSLRAGLEGLPSTILYTLEWSCLFYALGCCLRRNRVLTISVVVGIPLLMFILMLVPAVQEAVRAVDAADKGQLMILGVQWLKVITDIMKFIAKEWQTIQLVAAVASLPVSYLLMRSTPQP